MMNKDLTLMEAVANVQIEWRLLVESFKEAIGFNKWMK